LDNETNAQSRALFSQRSFSYEASQDHQRSSIETNLLHRSIFIESLDNSYKPGSLPNERQLGFATTTKYPKEMQRVDFVSCACEKDKSKHFISNIPFIQTPLITGYAVTIIVEGGINTCVAVLNDIQMKRPVIFIQVFIVDQYIRTVYCFLFTISIREVAKLLMLLPVYWILLPKMIILRLG
jgi:hypothetical protein